MTDEAASDQPEALDLLMAGLIAARQLAPAEDGRPWSRTAMATGVARHERSRIERLAKDRNVSAATLAHLVAVVTLGGGIAIDAARPMIEEELAALPRSDSGSALDLREVLIEALREKERARIPPVVPDLIGEAFVVDAFGKLTPAEQGEAVARGYRRSPNATAAAVIRTAQDFAETEDHPALSWIDELAERCETINDLMQLADAFPHDTVVLRERAAAITANVANHLRSAAEESVNPDALATRARWLNDLSGRLSALGRREEALLAVEESVAIYRDLVRGRSVASLYGLARALTNFASWLGDLGRHEEALSASEDSVAILRELATGSPDALLPRLAGSLTNFANTLSHVGRREEALSAADESAAIYRKLASKRPDAFRAGLAMSLITLASWRSAGGAWEEALSAAGESVAIYRELERDDFTSGHIRRARNSLCIRLR